MGLSFDLEPETGEISMNTEQKTLKQLSMDEKVIDKMKATSIRATDDVRIKEMKHQHQIIIKIIFIFDNFLYDELRKK